MKIPRSPSPSVDARIWHYEKSGHFTVRSAYHMGMNFMARGTAGRDIPGSSTGTEGSLWTQLWAAPPKVRMLGWRICSKILPTKMNLFKRLKHGDVGCPR